MIRFLLIALAASALSSCTAGVNGLLVGPEAEAVGGNLYIETLESGGQILILDGEITPQTSYHYLSIVEHSAQVGDLLIAQSPGGDVDAALQIGRSIQREGISVVVLGNCFSACVSLMIAGKQRAIAPESRLGLHASNNGPESVTYEEDYWDDFGLKPVIRQGYQVPFEDIWIIEPEQAIELGLATEILS